jgi:hypothetical protein
MSYFANLSTKKVNMEEVARTLSKIKGMYISHFVVLQSRMPRRNPGKIVQPPIFTLKLNQVFSDLAEIE